MTETHELVVPRSIPITFDMRFHSSVLASGPPGIKPGPEKLGTQSASVDVLSERPVSIIQLHKSHRWPVPDVAVVDDVMSWLRRGEIGLVLNCLRLDI
jgi:hypothetical protein